MKKSILIILLGITFTLFAQNNLMNDNNIKPVKFISIDVEIEKLNDLVNKLSKVEITINSSTGNLTVLQDVVVAHNKKTQETAAKIAKLNSSREELERQIKELESSISIPNIITQHDTKIVQAPKLQTPKEVIEEDDTELEVGEEMIVEEGCGACDEEKDNLAKKMEEFNRIRNKMSGKVSKNEYATLHKQYNSTWAEVNDIKRQIQECELESKNLPVALYNEALEAKQMEDYDDALELLEEAISLKPDFDEAYYQIVSILIELDENSEIDGYLGKISDSKKKGKLYYCRAMNSKDSHPKEAITHLKAMSNHYKPELANYYIGLINITKLSNPDVAVKYLKKSLKINSTDPKVLDLIGATYLDMKVAKGQDKNTNITKAIEYLEKGVSNGSGYKGLDLLFSRLAQAYNKVGKSNSALKYADLAIAQASINSLATANLEKAKALIKMDKSSEAITFLEIAKKDYLTKDEATYWINICQQ